MSNDLALLNQAPDYLKEVGIDNMTKALSGNTSVKRISIRGGVFRMMVNGEEIAKNENRSMGIVIVNGNPKVSRQFYAGKYTPERPPPPTVGAMTVRSRMPALSTRNILLVTDARRTSRALVRATLVLAATSNDWQFC